MGAGSVASFRVVRFWFFIISGFIAVLGLTPGWGAPHFGDAFEFKQPDGSLVPVRVFGDEFYQTVESPEGYTLIRNPITKWIEYAVLTADGKDLRSSGIRYKPEALTVNKLLQYNGVQISKHLRIPVEEIETKVLSRRRDMGVPTTAETMAELATRPLGRKRAAPQTIIGLTLLVDFTDQPSDISWQEIDDFFHKPGYGSSGSIKDYFLDVSDSNLIYENIVAPFVTLTKPKSYYDVDGTYGPISELITDALSQLEDQGFNFSTITTRNQRAVALNILYAGQPENGWAAGLWPHSANYNGNFSAGEVRFGRYQLTNIGNAPSMGTIIHENGHLLFGWPDLYSYSDHHSNPGRFCIMAANNNTNPQLPNAYLRSLEGWIELIDISNAPLGSRFSHRANSNSAYIYRGEGNGSSEEMFVIEARLQEGRGQGLPDEGLLIWHIDEEGSNSDDRASELYIALEQADGDFDMENRSNSGDRDDAFDAVSNSRFADETTPSARWHNGAASGLDIANISEVGEEMFFTLGENLTPFILLASLADGLQLEQGQHLDISWFDNIEGNVRLELLQNGIPVSVLEPSLPSESPYRWQIGLDIPPGTGYTLRATSLDDETITSTAEGAIAIVPEFVVQDFPYLETFDSFSPTGPLVNHWSQADDDDLDWSVLSGATPSKLHPDGGGTGPDEDHTGQDGNYIYTEASGENHPDKIMVLLTPKFNLTKVEQPILNFYLHMFSADLNMGNLWIRVVNDGVPGDTIFHQTGDHGDEWLPVNLDISAYRGERTQFEFIGETGQDYDSDISIDDVSITGNVISGILPSQIKGEKPYLLLGHRLKLSEGLGKVEILNLRGRPVQSLNVEKATVLDLSGENPGLYLLKFKGGAFKLVL